MASATNIEWTEFNWNPLSGCSRKSSGCEHCYAEKMTKRLAAMGQEKYQGLLNEHGRFNGVIKFSETDLLAPLRWKKPRKVFVNSMSDLFHENVKDEWIDKMFAVMALTPQHTYQILTKRPERMLRYVNQTEGGGPLTDVITRVAYRMKTVAPIELRRNWPLPNVWLGVSVEDQKTANERIPLLLQTPAAVRWISAEPLIGPVDLVDMPELDLKDDFECVMERDWDWLGHQFLLDEQTEKEAIRDKWMHKRFCQRCGNHFANPLHREHGGFIDWVVVGGESGHGARPFDIAWARSIIQQCKAAGVPVFVKQLGANPVNSNLRDVWGPTGKHHYTRPISDPLIAEAESTPGYTVTVQDMRRHQTNQKGGDINEWPLDLRVREYPK